MYKYEDFNSLPYTDKIFTNLLSTLALFEPTELLSMTNHNDRVFEFHAFNKRASKSFYYHYYFARPNAKMAGILTDMVKNEFPNISIDWTADE